MLYVTQTMCLILSKTATKFKKRLDKFGHHKFKLCNQIFKMFAFGDIYLHFSLIFYMLASLNFLEGNAEHFPTICFNV